MNKLFTKIVGAALGLTMAIGVGVAVASNREAVPVRAGSYEGTFNKVTGTSLTVGKKYILTYGTNVLGNTVSSSKIQNASNLTITSGQSTITNPDESAVWTLGTRTVTGTGGGDFYTWYNDAVSKYLLGNTGNARCSLDASANDTTACWTLSASNGTFDFVLKGNTRRLRTTGSGWGSYAAQNGGPLTLYEEASSASTPTVSWKTGNSKELTYVGSSALDLEAQAQNFTPTSWSWSASPSGIVSIEDADEIAEITPTAAGTTTITAEATDGTNTKSVTCAVTVTSKSGADTSNILTVDDAILIANYTGTTETTKSYYMEGVVTGTYNDAGKYPMLGTLEVYKDCSGTVYTGDTIRVYGPIKTYSGTPEFTGSSTVTVVKVPVNSVSASVSTPVPTGVTGGDLSSYLTVTVSGTNSRNATDASWKVTNSSNTSVIAISGSDGKTFNSGSSVGTTTLTIASVDDNTKTTTVEVTLFDASIPVLQSVTVGGTPSKATQYVGQAFDWAGLTFTPVYSPAKAQTESITGADIDWDALVAGQSPTGTYTGDDDVSKTVTVTSVSVEEDGIYSVHVSGDMSTKTYDEDGSWDYTGLVVKVTYKSDHETQVSPTSTVTWSASSTPKQLGVGTDKSVNVTATVGEVASAAYAVTGLTITEHVAAVYGLYSGTLTEGDYVITHNSSVALTNELATNTNYIGYTDVSSDVSESAITDPDSSIVWHIAQSGDYWTIYNSAATNYAASTGVKNKGQVLASPVAAADTDKTLWSCTSTSSSTSYDFVNKANTAGSVNATLRYNSGYGFATYATATGQALSLYKLGYTVKSLSSISIDSEPDKTEYNEGETLDLTGLVVLANWSDSTSTELTSSDYTVTPSVSTALATTDDEVTISYTYNDVEKTATFGITVSSVPLSERDKVLDATSLNLNGTSYAANDGNHKVDGVNFATKDIYLSGGTMQFKRSSGVLSNAGVMFDGTSGAIKYITVFMNSDNADEIVVSESSDGTSYTTVSVSGTYSTTGVNVYSFSAGSTYFKVGASSSSVAKIDRVVVELVDGASTSLTKARNAAQAILDNLSGLCGEGGSGVVTQSQWNTLTSAVNTALGNDSEAKAILKNATKLAIHDLSQDNLLIENAMYHYDACVEKFGFTPDSSVSAVQASQKVPSSIMNETSNYAAIIIIISLMGITAIGGYFFLKKRKEQ